MSELIVVPGRRLGRLSPRTDRRTLHMSKYVKALAPPPANCGYVSAIASWPMDLNDCLGDCTFAAADHMIEQWTGYANPPAVLITDEQTLDAYEAVSGYNPNDSSSDNGAVMLDVLKYWRATGIGGHKIVAYVSVNFKDHTEVMQAVQLFGNCYVGISLPVSAQNPVPGFNGNPVWSTPGGGPVGDGAPGSWGGHSVPIVGYGVDGEGNAGTEVITWGQVYDMTWGFVDNYVEEAWAVLSADWIEPDKLAPSGFSLSELQADLRDVTGQTVALTEKRSTQVRLSHLLRK